MARIQMANLTKRQIALVVGAVLGFLLLSVGGTVAYLLIGGDSGDSKTTATVESVADQRICLRPEDPEQVRDLGDCHPAKQVDTALVRPGDCIAVTIPFVDEGEKRKPLQSIRVLNRECRR